jgi:ABC-type transporter Mla subunit MlaD
MADNPAPGFGDLVAMFGTNPFSNVTKSFQQFQRGVEQLMTTIDNLNKTLEQLNEVSVRVTRMLDLLEEPAKALVPQVTRTIRAADEMVERMNAPLERIAPGLARLAETLQNPALNALPRDLNEFLSTIRDVGRRLQPLGQMAESAGGMFRNSPFAAFMPQSRSEPAPAPVTARASAVDDDDDDDDDEAAGSRPVRNKASGQKAAAARKRPAANRTTTKKATTRKPTTRKPSAS